MKKIVKRLLIILLTAAVIVGGTYGGLTIYRNANAKPVKVYKVNELAETNIWLDQNEMSGYVEMDRLQKIYLSNTQSVTKVFVKKGQKVKAGDPLLAFDTTLSELDVEKADIALQKKKLETETKKAFLERLASARITEDLEGQLKSIERQIQQAYDSMPEPVYPEIPLGEWTEESPRYIENTGVIDPEELLEESGLDHIFVVLVDGFDGQYFGYYGLEIFSPDYVEETGEEEASEDPGETPQNDPENPPEAPGEETPAPAQGSLKIAVFYPSPLEAEPVEEPPIIRTLEAQYEAVMRLLSESYTREELASLKVQTEKEIRDLELEIRMDEVALAKAKDEVGDGTVKADIDGVVVNVLPIKEMGASYEAVLTISGGGGYNIKGYVGEYDRENLKVGQEVTLSSWNGSMTIGTITEIGDRPDDYYQGWSGGNNNISWYPFTVFADADSNFEENDWVSITCDSEQDAGNAWYLIRFMIREENGRSYVYRKGDDGLLHKQYIQTGKTVWDEYVEIRGGLSLKERIAFPYGQEVKENAKTEDADVDALYNDGNTVLY